MSLTRVFSSTSFGSDTIKPSPCSRNIGVVFDSTMSMLPHVNSLCKSALYHLRNISRIRKLLCTKITETLVHAFVTSKLDHCNSLLYDVQKYVIKKLQLGAECRGSTDYKLSQVRPNQPYFTRLALASSFRAN